MCVCVGGGGWALGIAQATNPPVSIHLISGVAPRSALPLECVIARDNAVVCCVDRGVRLFRLPASPWHLQLRAAQVPTLKGKTLTLYSTLSYSIKLLEKAAPTTLFYYFYGISLDFSSYRHFFIVSLPQSICPTNSLASQGLQCMSVCYLDVCQDS